MKVRDWELIRPHIHFQNPTSNCPHINASQAKQALLCNSDLLTHLLHTWNLCICVPVVMYVSPCSTSAHMYAHMCRPEISMDSPPFSSFLLRCIVHWSCKTDSQSPCLHPVALRLCLNTIMLSLLHGCEGFEPGSPCSCSKYLTKASLHPLTLIYLETGSREVQAEPAMSSRMAWISDPPPHQVDVVPGSNPGLSAC